MVSNKDIKGLDFGHITEYFNYVTESIINGQRQQARQLIKKMSKTQRHDALNFYKFDIEGGELLDELTNMLIEA